MLDQKILTPPFVSYSQQPASQTQPTTISSPSSGYHTISPPSSLTRRNSDTKEFPDDLTATTTATNSDDDFLASNSAPASPPAQFPNQSYHQFRRSPEHWSQQQPQKQTKCSPAFDWLSTVQSQPTIPATNLAHFQPYVNDQFMTSPTTIQRPTTGWYTQQQETNQNTFGLAAQRSAVPNQWDQRTANVEKINSILDSNPAMCNFFMHQLAQQRQQPPKAPSPIGTKPTNYVQQKNETDAKIPSNIAEQIKFLANEDDGPEILQLAVQFAMKVKSQKSNANASQAPQQPVLWQNIKDQPMVSFQTTFFKLYF